MDTFSERNTQDVFCIHFYLANQLYSTLRDRLLRQSVACVLLNLQKKVLGWQYGIRQ
jgi:hypothetical protein